MIKIFKRNNPGFRIRVGMFYFRWFIGTGVRFEINPKTDFWIRTLGFNYKHFGI